MIGKGKSIAHTEASLGYGWNEEKEAKVIFREHLAGDNPKEITQEFKIVQSQNHRCKKNTLSFVLSPTIEDGRDLRDKELKEMTERFVKEMKLYERQAIAFVHQNKAHLHIHLYVNRIGFDGKAYKDNYVGKRSQLAAEKVAKQVGLTTVKEVQQEKLNKVKNIRQEIKQIHERVITELKPKDFDQYIKYIKQNNVKVIQNYGTSINENLEQLWRRIVFNITVSNTDDHLRNHGFILTPKGWVLSPAYDINPAIDKDGLGLNIDVDNNTLDLELAKSVGEFFRLGDKQMDSIIKEVLSSVRQWKTMADKIGISRGEQELMAGAFFN